MPTWREFSRVAFQCSRYEAQDVLVDIDDVDVIPVRPAAGFPLREKWHRRLLWRDITRKIAYLNPGLKSVRLERDYDLFILVCGTWWDLLYVNAIKDWKEHCKTSVIWIDELWASMVPHYRYWLQSLTRFDYVILGMNGSVGPVSSAIQRPCYYVPGAVDAMRFTPFPAPPARVIDVYSVGRKLEPIHRALLETSRQNKLFYMHDTLHSGESVAQNPKQHREMYADMAKRSRYFMVAPGKFNVKEETQGQVEVGYRYFEGAAAGTVMIGQAAKCDAFSRMFDWPDSVIEIQPDGSDVADVLSNLAQQPERLQTVSRRNTSEALLRHDWSYRWENILKIAGLPPAPALSDRKHRLRRLSEMALNSAHD